MEDRGIIRRIDDLGRIVIPREYRKLYGIDNSVESDSAFSIYREFIYTVGISENIACIIRKPCENSVIFVFTRALPYFP